MAAQATREQVLGLRCRSAVDGKHTKAHHAQVPGRSQIECQGTSPATRGTLDDAVVAAAAAALDQRQRDVLALALIAVGVFMGFVLYGSAGTQAGGGRRSRAGGGVWSRRGPRKGARADRAGGRRRGAADAPSPAGAAPTAGWEPLRSVRGRAGAGGGHVGRERGPGRDGRRPLAVVGALPPGARRRGGAGAVRGGARAGAAGGRGHPRGVPARGRRGAADGRLAGERAAGDRQRRGGQHQAAHPRGGAPPGPRAAGRERASGAVAPSDRAAAPPGARAGGAGGEGDARGGAFAG